MLRIFAASTEDSDLSPLPPTPGRAVRVFSEPQPRTVHCDSTDEMLAIMGEVDAQQDSGQDNVCMSPTLHKLMMNPEVMSFKLYKSCVSEDESSGVLGGYQDITAPKFLKIRVASHAYHTFVPTVGTGSNTTQKNEAKVLVHTKTEFLFAFPSKRQVNKNFTYMYNFSPSSLHEPENHDTSALSVMLFCDT